MNMITSEELIKACCVACFLNREVSREAYDKMGYALTAPDVIAELVNRMKTFHKF